MLIQPFDTLIQNVLNASIGGSILMVVYKRVIDTWRVETHG